MDKKTLDSITETIAIIIVGTVLFLLIAIFVVYPLVIMVLNFNTPPTLYFPNQDENGFFMRCIDGFMAGCTPQGCVPSDPVIECQIIQINVGEKS